MTLLPEPGPHRGGHHRADPLDRLQLLDRGRGQRPQARETARQVAGRALADVGDAEGEEQAVEGAAAGLLELAHEVGGRHLAPPGERGQPARLEVEQGGGVRDQAGRCQLLEEAVAEALDVHRRAPDEVAQPRRHHPRAVAVGAANGDLALLPLDRAAAGRAARRPGEGDGVGGALGADHPLDLGDDIPPLADPHRVADPHVQALDLVEVVQGGAGHGRAHDRHRLQHRHRGQHPGATDLDHDLPHPGRAPLGRELEGHRPAHRPGGGAEATLLAGPVDLEHDPVGVEVQGRALRAPAGQVRPGLLEARAPLPAGADREAQPGQPLEPLRVAVQVVALDPGQLVAEQAQGAAGRLPRVEEPDRPGGRVARVGELRLARRPPRAVELGQTAARQVDLAPHLEQGRGADHRQGQLADGAGVGGDVVPHHPVAAGHRPHQETALVDEGDRHAVDLELGRQPGGRRPQLAGDPLVPGLQLALRVGVVEGQHGQGVGHLLEPGERLATDPPGGRVGRRQVGPLLLQPRELGEQAVVLEVLDLGAGEDVVLVVVVADLPPQLEHPERLGVARRHRLLRPRRRRRRRVRATGSTTTSGSASPP